MSGADRGLLFPSILTVCALAILLGLGSWQLDRRDSKHALLASLQDRLAGPAIELWDALPDGEAEFRRATLSGSFLHDKEFRLLARTRNGRQGYNLVTPLRLTDGRIVLVDRGWMPDEGGAADRPEGPVTVEGVIRRPPEPGWAGPENLPEAGQWLYIEPTAVARASGLAVEESYYLMALAAPEGSLPRGTAAMPDLTDNHLQYAMTWCGLALALAAVFALWLGRPDSTTHPATS
ncbi:MAG: SURF1 family protein [Proteobacteria bacterium]|nr:SURF1 family protein [Pseudomonadota bacterium]